MQFYIEQISRVPLIVLIFLAASSGVIGDIYAKYWSIDNRLSYFLVSMFFYVGSGFFFAPTLLKEGLVLTSTMWTIINVIGFLLVGLVMFKETLNPWLFVGICLGIVALILLSIETKQV